MTHWNTGRQLVGLTGLCVGWWVLSLLLLKVGYWSPTALPIVLFSLTGGAVALNERLRENFLLKREVEQLWQAHYRDLVVEGTKSQTRTFEVHGWNLNQQPVSMQRVAQLAALAEQFGRSQSAQAAIARSLSIGLLAADLDGRVWFCNPVATDWLKVQVGDRLLAQLIPQWLSQPEWQADLDLLRYSQQAPYRELQRGDRWFALKLEPLFYQSTPTNDMERSDQLSGLLLVLEDITASKQVEANLNLQMQELQRMNLLKDDFLSTVSHELRTPMTNMKMAIHLLKLSRNEEQRDHYLRILQDECAREISLINDLLDLQRLEVTAKPLVSEVIDLADWLPLVVEPFLERAETRQQTLQTEIPRDLPPLVSDRLSLERVLAELINNACKYTPPGGEITVKVHYIPAQIELIVSNSGSEIAEAELERIFDKFYRIPRHDPWKQGGTGLGLALVKKLVEHLGGNIQVWSRDGETKFIVQLPAEFQETTDASEN
jgi:signal transduction histidine kinase